MTMDPRSRLTTTTHGYPLSSYCVGLPKAPRTDPEGNVHSVPSDCQNDGLPIPLDDLFAGLRIDDVLAYSMKDMHTSLMSTQPTFLNMLPPEIIYKILSFMLPEDYVGFAGTCRFALELSNIQVALEWPALITSQTPSWPPCLKEEISVLEKSPNLKNYLSAVRILKEEDWDTVCLGNFWDIDEENDVDL